MASEAGEALFSDVFRRADKNGAGRQREERESEAESEDVGDTRRREAHRCGSKKREGGREGVCVCVCVCVCVGWVGSVKVW